MIQEKINKVLEKAIQDKASKDFISNIKFLKAETQRGKTKEMNDSDIISIFVSLIRKQNEMRSKLNFTSKEYHDSLNFVNDISLFLDQDIIDQINMSSNNLIAWIENNIDFSKYKSKMQSIKDIKTQFPYMDGNLIKKVLEKM